MYDISGNAGTRERLKGYATLASQQLLELYPSPKYRIQPFPNQDFDHALNKSLCIATKSRTASSVKKDWDYCNGTHLIKQTNIAKTGKNFNSLKRDPIFNYQKGTLFDLLQDHGTRGIAHVKHYFGTHPELLLFDQQKALQILGMEKALKAQLTLINKNFVETHQIGDNDHILALDINLVRGTLSPYIEHTRAFYLVNENQAFRHVEGCLDATSRRFDFLESGVYHLFENSPDYAYTCRRGVNGELGVLTNVLEERISGAKRVFPSLDDKTLLGKIDTLRMQNMSLLSNTTSNFHIKPRDELFEYGKNPLQLDSMDGAFGRYWYNKRLVEKSEKGFFVDDIVVY